LRNVPTEEQHSVVLFLWAKGPNAKDVYKEMCPVYSGKCLSHKAVKNWVEKFSQGCSKVADDAHQVCPVEIVTEAAVQRVEKLIPADRKIMIDKVAAALGCSHGLAYSIMHDCLKFQKVCARWVPRELKDREKRKNRMGLSLQHLLLYADEGVNMLNSIVTGDESWVHHHQPDCFIAMETSQFTFSHKVSGYTISWEGYAYCVLGFSGSTVSPFSEAW
jgi:hypothetical protein